MNFSKLFTEYTKSPGFLGLADRSKDLYIYSGEKLSEFLGDKDVSTIKRSDMLKYQNKYAETPGHASMAVRIASVVFTFAVDMDYMQFNPAARIKKPKATGHIKWTPEEVRNVIALRDRKISTAVALAWYTGQRESDILNMRWCDFDGQYIAVRQQKTGLEMKIKAHPDLVAYLNGIREDSPKEHYIVSGRVPMMGNAFRNMLKRRTDKMNIDKVFHGIRKGVASALAEGRTPLLEIAALMGHKSIRMAAYYAGQADSKILTDSAVDNLVTVAA